MDKRLISVIHLTLEVDDTPKNRKFMAKLYDLITNAVTKKVATSVEGEEKMYVNNWNQITTKDVYLSMVNGRTDGKEQQTWTPPRA